MTHVVALSGGKDSTAMALRLAEVEPQEYRYICTPTGRELPAMEAHKIAILAGLAITDELFQARRGDRDIADRITGLADELARLLPPAKRGKRAAAS